MKCCIHCHWSSISFRLFAKLVVTRLYTGEPLQHQSLEAGVTYQYYTYLRSTAIDFIFEVSDSASNADFEVHAEAVSATFDYPDAHCDDYLAGPRGQCFIGEFALDDPTAGETIDDVIVVVEVMALLDTFDTTISMAFYGK